MEVKLLNKKENIFGDNIAFVEQWDFSRANLSDENRLRAITQVASICYQNPNALGSESLYNRLLAESKGLPSSSFEFVPVLLTQEEVTSLYFKRDLFVSDNNPITKFGEWIIDGKYLITNFRAIIYLKEYLNIDLTKRYNTEIECEIIKQHFKVFKYKVDLPTRSQMVRHRVNWQELSRRYVSGKRVPFEFYVSEKMKGLESDHEDYFQDGMSDFETDFTNTHSTEELIEMCVEHYYQALEKGVKPQEARRIIPQGAYTQIWGAFMPKQLNNYFKLRLDSHAQWEIRQTAEAMQELIKDSKDVE